MLNSVETLKRYFKITLNVFLNKKFSDDDKKIYLFGRLFVSNQNFTTKHIKIV